ncbi:hypothetical protein GAH_00415 [Geoglobus ahangari]|uniref:Damage-control phosphatase ARMT1-like metal-binding domain-containing protein n=1 Tax=Geoglobus ahangari TaxID=113653 RepID=A0A0F7IF33_9EURY|nr:damage-control phosphatase [Geoglobus ahangari]AKG92233.1 hypothetical protein GAH_00415 [Geoglobus ahangari]
MRMSAKCPACLLNRIYQECRMVSDDEEKIGRIIERAMEMILEEFRRREVNAIASTRVHRMVYRMLDNDDPYRELKRRANEETARILPLARRYVERGDRFRNAVVASIIGNSFDYGVLGHEVNDSNFREYFEREFRRGLAIDDVDEIRHLCRGRVVYLADNAGEIVLDRLLVEEIKRLEGRVSFVVRGRPVLSDATIEDARFAGIDEVADEILTNGQGAIGIIEEELPEDTRERMESADIIISKGMANYECLSEGSFDSIAFLLKAKCEPVARDVGVRVGDMVAMLR